MLTRMYKFARAAMLGLVIAGGMLAFNSQALADKIHLKDGRVLEGTLVREGDGFVFFKIKVGEVSTEQLFQRDDILKIERDDQTPKTDEAMAKAEEAKNTKADSGKKDERTHTGATRVAILNFGAPSSWQGSVGDMVGVQISAEAFKKAIPLLEKAKTDIVVIRVMSGGGYGLEVGKFHEIFEKEYKPRFRTVAWIESAISAAAMSPWVIEEMYMMPNGNIGACTMWHGRLVASKGLDLEMVLDQMEKASALGKKDPRIMRAMQILGAPLSVDVDENGQVHWRQDEDGQFLLNPGRQILTLNANDAVKFKFAKGIAATKEELAKVMNLQEVEWVAQDATDLIDKNMKENDAVEKHNKGVLEKYDLAISLAQQLQDKERRGQQLAAAKRYLAELRKMIKVNPNFEFHLQIPPEWFVEQDELIKKLSQLP